MNDENINRKILEDLKNLPKVEAPKNFETELLRKINSSNKTKEKSFWENLLTPPKLVPAAVALASAIIIFFVVDGNSEVMEDPLNIAPRLREDILITETMDDVILQNEIEELNKRSKPEQKSSRQESVKENYKDKPAEIEKRDTEDMLGSNRGIISGESYIEETTVDTNQSDEVQRTEGNFAPAPVSVSPQEINKNSLNFMQRSLSTQEKQEVQQLKMKTTIKKDTENQQKVDKTP